MTQKVITRFPPSPTGPLHIGNVRTALFNYLFAKHNGGKFILRIEDTDKARSKEEFEKGMLEGLEWLGLKWDNKPERQSERTGVYKKYLEKLIKEDKVYVSLETEGENKEVIRFRNPNKTVSFEDLVRGEVKFDTKELGDFIIAKNINEPLYHLAVVIDDFEAWVTHVIRGEDHVSNTPRQILIQEAIGAPRPVYAHLPLILASDRSKLSKRKHGESVSLDYYRKKGYLPQAILNYLSLLGWNPGTDKEIFTLEELIKDFDVEKIQKGGAIFDEKKLDWVNKEHVKLLSPEERIKLVAKDFDAQTKPKLVKEKISWKKISSEETKKHLEKAKEILKKDGDLMSYASEMGKGNVLWPLRYALSGQEVSPDPFTLISILGKEESIKRIDECLKLLE
ncbi:MAG: glutamate--tRNA ligase family protein [Patescibacteria group bacterium]